jgi:hypothetical protein
MERPSPGAIQQSSFNFILCTQLAMNKDDQKRSVNDAPFAFSGDGGLLAFGCLLNHQH